MDGYSVKITASSVELSAKEKIMAKDTSDAISIDEATQENPLEIAFAYYVVLDIHNEKSDNKDYQKIVVFDRYGQKYVTGSKSFYESLQNIVEEMNDAGETEYGIKCIRKDSKNYKGKQFITCSVI